jgi:hypothetical protein
MTKGSGPLQFLAFMSNLSWQSLPPLRETDSATALAAAGDLLLAGTPAGLFKRAKGRWSRVELPATEIQAIVVGGDPELIAVGAGSAIEISIDDGDTWDHVDLDTTARVTALSVAGPVLLAGTDSDGIFRSTNSGKTWRKFGLDKQMVLAAAGDSLAGTDTGVWQHTAGEEWKKMSLESVCTALYAEGDLIVAGTEEEGVFRSTDKGKTWQKCGGVDEGINALAGSGQRIVAGTSVGRVYLSEDGGAGWRELEALPTAAMAVAIEGQAVLAGTYRSGVFRLTDGHWQPDNAGLESTNVIDMLMTPQGLVLVALDGLQKLENGAWVPYDPGVPGDPRAAAVDGKGQLLLATTEGLFAAGGQKLGDLKDVGLIRCAPNGDLAVLTEDSLHLRLGEKWTQLPRRESERTIDVAFSPSYPDDEGLMLCTLRQGTRVSVVRFAPKSQDVDRIFDYDRGSRWLAVGLPPDYKVDTRRPANFFAGTGDSLYRPAWPGDNFQRDVLHAPNAIVLSIAVSPEFRSDKRVLVGTTNGAVITRNGGLLWATLDEGLDDKRCLKMVFDGPNRVFCLTPTRVYRFEENPVG